MKNSGEDIEDKVRQSPKIRGKITKKNENFMSGQPTFISSRFQKEKLEKNLKIHNNFQKIKIKFPNTEKTSSLKESTDILGVGGHTHIMQKFQGQGSNPGTAVTTLDP